MSQFFLEIALPVPLKQTFDYLPLNNTEPHHYKIGARVLVPFGRRKLVGIILALKNASLFYEKLKIIETIIDSTPLISQQQLNLACWASKYYHYQVGEIISMCLPTALRGTKAVVSKENPEPKSTPDKVTPKRQQHPNEDHAQLTPALKLTTEQQAVINSVIATPQFNIFLLYGITGSGKTEVYLQIIANLLQQKKQILVLLPEISLTPQTLQRFEERFPNQATTINSKISEKIKKEHWLMALHQQKNIVIGTRSALFCNMPQLGLIIIDEEHDGSFKQQEGLRYSARDLAIIRAQKENIPILLGSATPSMESFNNSQSGKYFFHHLSKRATGASLPKINLVDLRTKSSKEKLSNQAMLAIKQALSKNNQVMIFINRRGFAPTFMCTACSYIFGCERCSVNLVVHLKSQKLICHHCCKQYAIPTTCHSCQTANVISVGKGTEQIEETIAHEFPDTEIIRIDSDTTQQKDALTTMLEKIADGGKKILIGTQILAKGHHFPNLALVVILDIDGFLYSSNFRATEAAAQLILQVAGRAGREHIAGEVIIETHHPHHDLFRFIQNHDYLGLLQSTRNEREKYNLPPFIRYTLVRAEGHDPTLTKKFLTMIKVSAPRTAHINLLGPISSPIFKRENYYRYQLLIEAPDSKNMQRFLGLLEQVILQNPLKNKIRYSIDVDPQDMG